MLPNTCSMRLVCMDPFLDAVAMLSEIQRQSLSLSCVVMLKLTFGPISIKITNILTAPNVNDDFVE